MIGKRDPIEVGDITIFDAGSRLFVIIGIDGDGVPISMDGDGRVESEGPPFVQEGERKL